MDLYQNRLSDHSLAIEQGRHRQTWKKIYLFIYNVLFIFYFNNNCLFVCEYIYAYLFMCLFAPYFTIKRNFLFFCIPNAKDFFKYIFHQFTTLKKCLSSFYPFQAQMLSRLHPLTDPDCS